MPETAPKAKNKPKKNTPKLLIAAQLKLRLRLAAISRGLKRMAKRSTFANIFMFCFIILTSIGAGMIFLPAGFLVAGVGCGIFGFLLGLE